MINNKIKMKISTRYNNSKSVWSKIQLKIFQNKNSQNYTDTPTNLQTQKFYTPLSATDNTSSQ